MDKTQDKFVIRINTTDDASIKYVAGFNGEHQVVVRGDKDHAKVFLTRGGAERFVNRYSDAGYGMDKDSTEVVPA
jgi:hypothetical protein